MLRIISVIRKEFIHIRRDPRTIGIIVIMPLMQLLIFGYAIDMDVKDIRLGILDHSRTPASRDLIRKFTGSDYFDCRVEMTDPSQIEDMFRSRSMIFSRL